MTAVQADYVRSRGIPSVGSWFTNEDLSGGGVIDIGVHAIDLALYLMEFPPVESVFAVTRTEFGDEEGYVHPDDWYATDEAVFDVEDSPTTMIRCADDQTISLEVAWAANQSESSKFVVRGTGADARLELGGDGLTLLDAGRQDIDHFIESTISDASLEHSGWAGRDYLFLDVVARDRSPEHHTVEQALIVQRVIDGIYRSAESGSVAEIGEDSGSDESPSEI